jgi:hypothetical protein
MLAAFALAVIFCLLIFIIIRQEMRRAVLASEAYAVATEALREDDGGGATASLCVARTKNVMMTKARCELRGRRHGLRRANLARRR